jgi:ferritin-like protein
MGSESWHEPYEKISEKTLNMSRAIKSLMEELEAIDWYQQRVDVCTDEELRKILAHNRDEEMEHAAMVLEWIRRNNPTFETHLRTYLFSEGEIIQIEATEMKNSKPGPSSENVRTSIPKTVGSLKQRKES